MTTDVFSPLPVKIAERLSYGRSVETLSSDGPKIDVVGDVHGCMDELLSLLDRAGYQVDAFNAQDTSPITISHPQGRTLVLLGDLTDRGPYSDQVLRLGMGLKLRGNGSVLMGNHDWKLYRFLIGRKIEVPHSLVTTLEQIVPLGTAFLEAVATFYTQVPHQIRVPLIWDHAYAGAENLWLTHGAAKAHRQGKADRVSFERSIYGYADGDTDEIGVLKRDDWADAYEGSDPVIHGHVVHAEPSLKNRVMCLDTGCVFGNKLTMFQMDTGDFLFEAAARNYSNEKRLFQ